MATKQLLATNPPPAKLSLLMTNGFSRSPRDFALSPDRKRLALKNGDGFDLFDAHTAQRLGKTESFAPERQGNTWNVAFNRDGNKLASRSTLRANVGMASDVITVWDVPAGNKKSQHVVSQNIDVKGPLCWLNSNYLMLFDGNVYKGAVFSLKDGRFHRVCGPESEQSFRACRAGRSHLVSGGAAVNARAELLAVDLPEENILEQMAPLGNDLPRWYFSPKGITHLRP